jgi:putative transposase
LLPIRAADTLVQQEHNSSELKGIHHGGENDMETNEVLAIIGGRVNEELLKRNEYLALENAILRSKIEGRIKFTDDECRRLAILAKDLGKKAMADIGPVVTPETLMTWYRKLVAEEFDSSKNREARGRPRVDTEIEDLVLQFACENDGWGYDRIAGAIQNLGYEISDETVGNILKRHGIPPVHGRKKGMSWAEFLETHKDVLVGCDFFTVEVLTPLGIFTMYVLFFIKLGSREVHVAGITPSPSERWMKQVARNVTMAGVGFLDGCKYLLMDRDSKFCPSFRFILRSAGVDPIRLPAKSPNLNSVAERWVLSIKSECLSRLILFGERSLGNAVAQYLDHYHQERNHQGLDNVIPFPKTAEVPSNTGPIQCRDRLGGLLKFYYREAV